MGYQEKSCGERHGGRCCRPRYAVVAGDVAFAYYRGGKRVGDSGEIVDWHGTVLGTATVTARWPVRSVADDPPIVSCYRLQVRATIAEVVYTGRTHDPLPFGRIKRNLSGDTVWCGRRRGAQRVRLPRVGRWRPRFVGAQLVTQPGLPGFDLPATLKPLKTAGDLAMGET